MALARMRATFILLVALCALARSLSVPDSDATGEMDTDPVLMGQSVELDCDGPATMWTRRSTTEETIALCSIDKGCSCKGPFADGNSKCRNAVTIDSNGGSSISFSSIKMEDAGVYRCYQDSNLLTEFSVTVINKRSLKLTLETSKGAIPPVIEDRRAVIPTDTILISCCMNFSGFALPSLDLTVGSDPDTQQVIPAVTAVKQQSSFYQNTMVMATVKVNAPQDDDLLVRCGDPDAPFGFRGEVLQPIHGPDFVNPQTDVMVKLTSDGAFLDCSADSYPEAVYRWRYRDRDMISIVDEDGPYLSTAREGTYQCLATNTITHASSSKLFTVISSTDHYGAFGTSTLATTITLITITVGALVGVLIGVLVWTRAKKRQSAASNARALHNAQQVYYTNAPPSYAEVAGQVPTTATDRNKGVASAQPTSSLQQEQLPSYVEATTPKDVPQQPPKPAAPETSAVVMV